MRNLLGLFLIFLTQFSFSNQLGIGAYLTSSSYLLIPYKLSDKRQLEGRFHYSNRFSSDTRYTDTSLGLSYLTFKTESEHVHPYYGAVIELSSDESDHTFGTDTKKLSFGPLIGFEYRIHSNITVSIEGEFVMEYSDISNKGQHWGSTMQSHSKIAYYF